MPAASRLAAAALVVLAIAAVACKPSSLTPFGLGTRGPDDTLGTYAGAWKGSTALGGDVTFQVSGSEVQNLIFYHATDGCKGFSFEDTPLLINGDSFGISGNLDPQGRLVFEATFTTADTCAGTYRFEGLQTSQNCPASGQGTFTATKIPPP